MKLKYRLVIVFVVIVSTNIVFYQLSISDLTTSGDSKPNEKLQQAIAAWPVREASPREIERRFQHRLEVLQGACKNYSGRPGLFSGRIHPLTIVADAHPPDLNLTLSFCPIPKVGYKTWWDILVTVKGDRSKFRLRTKRGQSHGTVRFVFVREPYSRVLSAYVDKLFVPNRYFDKIGRYIVKTFRRDASPESLRFGHDVTFREFIKYVIEAEGTGLKRDPHFVPLHDHCHMCKKKYKYIGHMETLAEDKDFILKAAQVSLNFKQNFSDSTLEVDLHWMLEKYSVRSMSMEKALQRLWRSWQIRGLMGKDVDFPLTAHDVDNITKNTKDKVKVLKDTVIRVARKAQSRSRSSAAGKHQRSEAMREAYGTVPLEDLLKLQKVLAMDFEMFGYDPDHVDVFSAQAWNPPSDFRYFQA